MRENKQYELFSKYPILFDRQGVSPLAQRGIEVGDGWFQILDDTLEKLQLMSETFGIPVFITQIKEKFGKLRMYISYETTNRPFGYILQDIIVSAESKSGFVCENCGKLGKTKTLGTALITVCEKCI